MSFAAMSAIGIVALLHFWFMALEMFLWEKPMGLRTFGNTPEKAATMAVLAKNQGLYNGFLAAGLVFALVRGDAAVAEFFLSCVVVAGLYGAKTASRGILYVQALPGAVALALTLFT